MDDADPKRDGRAAAAALQAEMALAGLAGRSPDGRAKRRPSAMTFQFRVLKALVLRDMASRHGESRLGYLMGILLPILTMTVIMLAFGLRGRTTPADFSLGAFVVTGYPLWQGFQGMYQRVLRAASKSDPLLMFPQITQLDLILAAIILEIATTTVVFVLLVIGVLVVFQDPLPEDPVGVLLCFWACAWLGAALGLILCAVARVAPTVVTVVNAFMRFGMWFSGVIFAVNRLPSWSWPYLRWNPLLHCIEGARHSWTSSFDAPIFDPVYIVAVGFVLTTFGFVLERASRRFVGS